MKNVKEMALLILAAIVLIMFGFRLNRAIQFHKEAKINAASGKRTAAFTNYIIHLVTCLILLSMLVGLLNNIISAHQG